MMIQRHLQVVRRENTEAIRRMLRKAKARTWDDAIQEAFDRGFIHDVARDELKARNPHGGCWS